MLLLAVSMAAGSAGQTKRFLMFAGRARTEAGAVCVMRAAPDRTYACSSLVRNRTVRLINIPELPVCSTIPYCICEGCSLPLEYGRLELCQSICSPRTFVAVLVSVDFCSAPAYPCVATSFACYAQKSVALCRWSACTATWMSQQGT